MDHASPARRAPLRAAGAPARRSRRSHGSRRAHRHTLPRRGRHARLKGHGMSGAFLLGAAGALVWLAAIIVLLRVSKRSPALIVVLSAALVYLAVLVVALAAGQPLAFWPLSAAYGFLTLGDGLRRALQIGVVADAGRFVQGGGLGAAGAGALGALHRRGQFWPPRGDRAQTGTRRTHGGRAHALAQGPPHRRRHLS